MKFTLNNNKRDASILNRLVLIARRQQTQEIKQRYEGRK